jgi:hypothetical protein
VAQHSRSWHHLLVRLSRPRLLLRAGLLLLGGGFMLWRAWEARLGARAGGLDPGAALLLDRVAWVEALVGLLALATAAVALVSLRRRPRRHLLHLEGAAPRPGADEPEREVRGSQDGGSPP